MGQICYVSNRAYGLCLRLAYQPCPHLSSTSFPSRSLELLSSPNFPSYHSLPSLGFLNITRGPQNDWIRCYNIHNRTWQYFWNSTSSYLGLHSSSRYLPPRSFSLLGDFSYPWAIPTSGLHSPLRSFSPFLRLPISLLLIIKII